MKIRKYICSTKKIAPYSNLKIKDINDNKIFWKVVKPLFLKKRLQVKNQAS